jgi:hypothetical protein
MADSRKVARGTAAAAAAVVLAIAVYPVAGEFFVELAREQGWYDRPSDRLAQMSASLSALGQADWFHWVGGWVIGLACGLWLDALLKRRQSPSFTATLRRPTQNGRPVPSPDLLRILKEYATAHSKVRLRYANMAEKSLADEIASVFALAG